MKIVTVNAVVDKLSMLCCIVAFGCFLALACRNGRDQQPKAEDALVLAGATIYPAPGEVAIEEGIIIIKDGLIEAVGNAAELEIPPAAKRVDCKGQFITAGFWNSHIHFHKPEWQGADSIPAARLEAQIKEMLSRHGFTYAFDISNLDLKNVLTMRKRIENGELKGPYLLTTGPPFTPPKGSPFYVAPLKLPEMDNPEQARAHVETQLAEGADGIKMWSASPDGEKVVYMPVEIGKAGVDAAHRQGKPVFAHPTDLAGVQAALNCGADILAHVAPEDRLPWSPEMISEMIRNDMAVIPTLKLYLWDLERNGIEAENHPLLTTAIQQAGDYYRAGGEILFGMDTGYMDDYDTLEELLLLQRAGLDFSAILATMTTLPARRFGWEGQTGQIRPGMQADLVILRNDPARDIQALSEVSCTLREGEVIYGKLE